MIGEHCALHEGVDGLLAFVVGDGILARKMLTENGGSF